MPHYKFTITVPGEGDTKVTHVRAVEAKNEAKALKHVLANTIKVEPLSVPDAMKLAADGIELETADAEPQP